MLNALAVSQVVLWVLVLALSAVAGLALFRWLDRKRKYTLAGKGGRARRAIRSRQVQILTTIGAAIIVVALVLPHLMVILVSFARDGSWTTQVRLPLLRAPNRERSGRNPRIPKLPVTS